MSNLYALLIGINYYLPNLLPGGLFFKNLRGCVADALLVESFLRTRIGVPAENITRLTSSVVGDNEQPVEDPSQWPTYENIVNAFKRLTETAAPGDQVFIHYSGHGNRAQTTRAFRRGKKLDEVLVPMDIGDSGHRYLRDTELHFLLRAMVDRGLLVTLVLDSCHSASGTRNVEPDWKQTAIRRGNKDDETIRDLNSLVASERELLELWESSQRKTRKAEAGSGWLLEPKGYVLLAACGSTEEASEHAFDGKQVHGALTYWMIEALQQIGPGFTYRILLDNVVANVHSQFSLQTPQLEGEGNRIVFGASEVPMQRGITVLKLFADGTVLLNAGEAHGLKGGMCFNIFPLRETNLTDSERSICQVEITEVLPLQARAKIVDGRDARTLQAGCQAMPVDAGRLRLGRRVRLVTSRNGAAGSGDAAVLDEINGAIERQSGPFITVASEQDVPDYFVTVNDNNEYVICDPAGREIPNLRPALSSTREAAPAVVKRLIHLSRYATVQQLDNNSPQSPLTRKVEVELIGKQEHYVAGEKPAPKRFKGRAVVKNGEWVILRVRNKYPKAVHITVLDLQLDWAITQIYPSRAGAFETIDSGDALTLPLHMTLPPAYECGIDIIKVFATVEATSFRSLEMPPLDQPALGAASRGVPTNKLEKFLSAFSTTNTNKRLATVPINTETLWAAHQVEIEVRR